MSVKMGGIADDLRRFLPYYIPAKREEGFIAELRNFPNPPTSFYTSIADPEPLQGDLWQTFTMYSHELEKVIRGVGVVVSNSCDLAANNKRLAPMSLAFAPSVTLKRYGEMLSEFGVGADKIAAHLVEVKAQRVTHIFYMPSKPIDGADRVAFLDKIQSLPASHVVEKNGYSKLASLSDVAFYLLIFKLSIHFCRIHEEIDRSPVAEVEGVLQ